jgi:hypothetical protein
MRQYHELHPNHLLLPRTAIPLGSWTVQVIEASQARHNMVSLNHDFRFANRGVSPESFRGCSRPRVSGGGR